MLLCVRASARIANTTITMMKKLSKAGDSKKVVNAAFQHPFTCVVSGPTKTGKTTFVKDLLTAPRELGLISTSFSHISIYIGTRLSDNPIFAEMSKMFSPDMFRIVEVGDLYGGDKKQFDEKFAQQFEEEMKTLGSNGCVVFDDMMMELDGANLLSSLFSKHSSHLGLSVFYLTQNVLHESKRRSEHRTVYINSQYLVLFKTALDSQIFSTLAKRLSAGTKKKYSSLMRMFQSVTEKYRYIIVSGNIDRDPSVVFTSDIFNVNPFPHQRVFTPTE